MEETINQPAPPRDESGATSPGDANPPHEPELDALVDAARVLLSGWVSLGLRLSRLLLRESARSLEQGARVLHSLAAVIEKKFEGPTDSSASGL